MSLDYRDTEWVAEHLGLEKSTIHKYLSDGVLPGIQLGKKWHVSESRLGDFLMKLEREQTRKRRVIAWMVRVVDQDVSIAEALISDGPAEEERRTERLAQRIVGFCEADDDSIASWLDDFAGLGFCPVCGLEVVVWQEDWDKDRNRLQLSDLCDKCSRATGKKRIHVAHGGGAMPQQEEA